MRYTVLGKTGLRVSALGFGCMRLPEKDGRVDRDQAIPLLHRAVALGVNLFDSATMYCHSDSERALGEAMQGMRDKVVISTKNPLRGPAPAWRAQLEESLRRLRTDYIDIYHHHGIGWGEFGKSFDPTRDGMTAQMLKAREEGLIRHIGFSFHDQPEGLKKLADTGYYENVIVQYNLLDQSNAEAIQYAHEKGMGVVVMGPVGGGRLGIASEQIEALTGAKSTVEAALRFVWAHPGVNVALSGMQNLDMLEANVALASSATPFTAAEVAALNDLVRQRKEKSGMYCSGCRYCCPVCSAGIAIPEILEMMNQEMVFGLPKGDQYRRLKSGAAECIYCGKCVEACPQKIEIPEKLRLAAKMWDPRLGTVIAAPALQQMDATGHYTLAVRASNFSPEPTEGVIELATASGAPLEPARATARLEGFERWNLSAKGAIGPDDNRLKVLTTTFGHGKTDRQEAEFRFLIVPLGVATDWTSGTWHEFAPQPAAFADGGTTAALHKARFRVGRDEQSLVVHIDVTDDFLYPTRADRDKGSYDVDAVELYLDGRSPARCGQSGYEDGVYQVFLYPGTPGSAHQAFYHCAKPIALAVESAPAPAGQSGYRLTVTIPFASFCPDGRQSRLGLDLAVNCANAQGKRIGQYTFAGDGQNWQNAARFARVFLPAR